MEIQGKTILVLGGAGLVGMAVCRQLLGDKPKKLVVSSLYETEVEQALRRLRAKHPGSETEMVGAHGNLFVREALKDRSRQEILDSPDHRRAILDDVVLPLSDEVLERATLHRLFQEHRPDVVIDCINTATALAYQDIYRSATEVMDHLDAGHGIETFRATLERHLCTLYTPQLIRHIQILYESLRKAGTRIYLKIGTSGTGGMGLNIPYTHSEERPSRMLLSKSAMAGAHTLLLFLMARTPDAPVVKEIKPAAAIAWKAIEYGPVTRGGQPIPLYDCPPDDAVDLDREPDLGASREFRTAGDGDDAVLRSVFIDTGENGMFSRAEFEVLTTLGQMEFVTPEEIARNVRFELVGINSGHDVVNALDHASMGPTYRAGALRHGALERLRSLESENGVASVAFEMLGPPRLSKLLYEAEVLRRIRGTMKDVLGSDPEQLAAEAVRLVESDPGFRSEMLSIGIPILLSDGRKLLRGPRVVIPTPWDRGEPNPERINRWCHEGWVDLRVTNMKHWQERFRAILQEIESLDRADTSSFYDRPAEHWSADSEINIGKTVGWLFISEEHGIRMKA